MTSKTYDFIVVGAGPAGCAITRRLAGSRGSPSVLLIEAGGRNDDLSYRVDGDRWIQRLKPSLNYGYWTVPQEHLNGRTVPYDAGRGLGGGTCINISAWNVGPRDDFDEIARLTGNDDWKWENAHQKLTQLESYSGTGPNIPQGVQDYLNPRSENHGTNGPLKIGFPHVWERDMKEFIDIWRDSGYQINLDQSSGDPLGVAVCPQTANNAFRSTAKDILDESLANLHVLTDMHVDRVGFEGRRAVGVVCGNTTYRASKEIVLSAGTLNTPKILMLSGIGPRDQLEKFGITLVQENARVGQGLKDHPYIPPTWIREDSSSDRPAYFRSKQLQAAARKQWEKDRTGPLASIYCCFGMGFFKNKKVLESSEFKALDESRKTHILRDTVPSYELIINGPSEDYFGNPDNTLALATIGIVCMNITSEGSVTLQSADPGAAPLLNPNFLAHPSDKRVAIEATKEVLRVAAGPHFQKNNVGVLHAPKSDSEDDILAYWKERALTTWHMSGTCRMGRVGTDDDICIDSAFKVIGVDGLRVADMSVLPIMPNSHTQTTAYLAGMIAGDKLVAEYELD